MPEESKKNQQKGKSDPKEQRRRRQGRQPAGPVEKIPEKQPERIIEKQSKETAKPEKPAFDPPGPEFYKNLKRETDEILKITEEANTKYKKKEIQSNWAKYEMPVESYDEIDEQEDMGADYEKLIQAPATAGGHFQFKHEKSWDTDSGPSLYDKYFDINMDLLTLAISTIPFHERNSLDESMFNENDLVTMNHRATKFKQKYYNDKKYNTPELEAQEKILKNLTSHSDNKSATIIKDEVIIDTCTIDDIAPCEKSLDTEEISDTVVNKTKIEKENEIAMTISSPVKEKIMKEVKQIAEIKLKPDLTTTIASTNNTGDEILFGNNEHNGKEELTKKPDVVFTKVEAPKENKVVHESKLKDDIQVTITKESPKNPVIESPEDLEKWLDDFLDG